MRGSIYLGKIAGIKIFIHWTFSLLILWVLFTTLREGKDMAEAILMVTLILTVFACVTLHELGHALTARIYHFNTRDITLLPIGGMARMDELPEKPLQELVVALAGPLVNAVIAILLAPFVFMMTMPNLDLETIELSWNTFLLHLLIVNIMLALFNLIPAFPMDGGRVFRAVLSFFIPRVKATLYAARTGQLVAIIFFIGGFFSNPFLSVIGIFIFLMAQSENDQVKARSILQDFKVRDVIMRNFHVLSPGQSVGEAADLLLNVQGKDFLVMDSGKIAGVLDRNSLLKVLSEKGREARVAEAMQTGIQPLHPETALDKVFTQFGKMRYSFLPVVEHGQLLGVIDLENITELIMIRGAVAHSEVPKQLHKP